MGEITLSVQNREKASPKKVALSRKAGLVPAVLYGHGSEGEMLWVDYIAFKKLYAVAGQSSLLELTREGKKAVNAIVHDVQLDPLSNRFTHVDFYQVRMDEELETHVPLELVGEAPAVREQGGILIQTLEEALVKCLPKDLPHALSVDVSVLKGFDDRIHLGDLKLPAGVTLLGETDTTVALVEAPRTDAQMAALDEKVEADVTKVEGVVKEAPAEEAPKA